MERTRGGTSLPPLKTSSLSAATTKHDPIESAPFGAAGVDPEALAQRFERLMALIGRLNYAWSNTESVLVPVLARLMGTEQRPAALVFLTLNTTRARLDLIERLARTDETRDEDELLRAVRRFRRLAALRNKLNHSIYDFDPRTGRASTQQTRVTTGPGGIEFGRVEELDDGTIASIERAIAELQDLNGVLWTCAKP